MAKGISSSGDILSKLVDGTELTQLWLDYQAAAAQQAAAFDPLVQLLTYKTTASYEAILAPGDSEGEFEEATEYGVPLSHRPDASPFLAGFGFSFYDLAARFTWQFLADATQAQTDAVAASAAAADGRLVFSRVMKQLFTTSRTVNKEGQTVYPFYAGAAGDKPSKYGVTAFADSHNHFVTSGSASLTSASLDAAIGLVEEHGYTVRRGYDVIVLMNKAEGNIARNYRSVANGGTAVHDFIPSLGGQFIIPSNQQVVGGQISDVWQNLGVVGSYNGAKIIVDDYIPAGYVVVIATGGPDNLSNPIGFREHVNPALQGFKLVKGLDEAYPIRDSYYLRGFGLGVRHRGAGAVMQVTANPAYTAPALYA